MEKIEVTHVLDFLSAMFENELACSTINSAKCDIATIVHMPPYKQITGIFNLIPPKPKLSFVMNVDILFRYFEQQGDNRLLSEIILTQKLIILLLLLGALRLSTI